jgi:hypothetical protein
MAFAAMGNSGNHKTFHSSLLLDLSLQQEFEYCLKIQKNQGTPPAGTHGQISDERWVMSN